MRNEDDDKMLEALIKESKDGFRIGASSLDELKDEIVRRVEKYADGQHKPYSASMMTLAFSKSARRWGREIGELLNELVDENRIHIYTTRRGARVLFPYQTVVDTIRMHQSETRDISDVYERQSEIRRRLRETLEAMETRYRDERRKDMGKA